MDIREESLKKHYEWAGKLEVVSRAKVEDSRSLSLAYTPGVAEPCKLIKEDNVSNSSLNFSAYSIIAFGAKHCYNTKNHYSKERDCL